MGLHLYAGHGVIERQQLEHVDGRMIVAIFEHQGRDDGARDRDFAARKTLVAAALKPQIGITRLAGPRAREGQLQSLCGQAADERGVDGFPHRAAQAGFAAVPQCHGGFACEHGVEQQQLIFPCPDAMIILCHPVIETEQAAAGRPRRRYQQRGAQRASQSKAMTCHANPGHQCRTLPEPVLADRRRRWRAARRWAGMPATPIRTGVVLAFAAIYLIWGPPSLAIAVVLRTMPPFASASLRTLVGGTLIYLWLRWRTPRPFAGLPLPRLIAAGMLLTGGGSGLTVWSQQRVPSGITALLISSVPLLVLLLNWVCFARRAPEPRALVGALVGLSGVALVVAHLPTLPGHVRPPYVIALLCAMLCWSVGTLVASGAVPAARVGAATCVQMAAGGTVLALLGLLNGDWSAFHPALVSRESWLGLG